MFDLSGKVAFLTGASGGFGRVLAAALAEHGADLALFARSPEGLSETAGLAARTGRRILICPGDVSVRGDVDGAAAKAIAEFGRVDILVNNAGVNSRCPIEEFPDEDWYRILNTNLTGPFFCARAVVPQMKRQRWGRIINIGSMLGLVALTERSAYCASKAGLHALTKVLALELAPFNITVNAIAPGPFVTEINRPVLDNPETNQFFLERIPLQRWGAPEEIGALVAYLASQESSYMTGSIVPLDGGWTAQ